MTASLRSGVDLAVVGCEAFRNEGPAFAALGLAGTVDLAVAVDLAVVVAARVVGAAAEVPGRLERGELLEVDRTTVFAGRLDAAVAGRDLEGCVLEVGRSVPEGGTADTGLDLAPGFVEADALRGALATDS